MIIRKITVSDVDKLQTIAKETFVQTFAADNTQENIENYLAKGFSTEKLMGEIENPNSQFFFAEEDGNLRGYLKMNFGEAQTELNDPESVEIERIYVLKEFHGKKVGQRLYEIAIDIAREFNKNYIWLGVWEKNPRAISFYRKNRFEEFGKHIFRFGNEEQTDIMMKLSLK